MPSLGEPLAGKRVLVSGGTTGIGRATVEFMLKEDALVATFARTTKNVDELKKVLPNVIAFTGDQSDPKSIEEIFKHTIEELGGIDILVISAGVGGRSVMGMDFEAWSKVIEVNLMGPMLMTQLAVKYLEPGSHVVIVGSLSAKTRSEGGDVYVASKSGIRGFADSAGRGLSEKGILMTLIEPGLTEAEMTTTGSSKVDVEKLIEDHKMMPAVDVARAIAFVTTQPAHMVIAQMQIRPRAQII